MKDHKGGFTLIETIIVIAILGILSMISYPSILNSLETRALENAARDIQSTLEAAKFRAVNTKLNHRVRFYQDASRWFFIIEREATAGNWATMSGTVAKGLLGKFVVTADLPLLGTGTDQAVVFDSMGMIENYSAADNSIELQSTKLQGHGQPDLRTIVVFSGGSVHYVKSASEG